MTKRLYLLSGLAVLLVAFLPLSLQDGDAQAYNPVRPTPSVPAPLTYTVNLPVVYNGVQVPVRPTPGPATPVRPTPALPTTTPPP